MKKYELLKNDTKMVNGHTVYRIRALIDFNNIKAGDLGGYVETYENLSHEDSAWIYDNAVAYEDAQIFDGAVLRDNAVARGETLIFGRATVKDDAVIMEQARVTGDTVVAGGAVVGARTVLFDEAYVF